MTGLNREIIYAISQMKEFERFLDSDLECCVLMDMHLALLSSMVRTAHEKGKKVFFHLDLLKGISADEYGCEYACQCLRADGIISSKVKVIETAKKNRRMAILRLFLIDSKSLERGISLCNTCQPDYVEILPGIACGILPYIQTRTSAKLMCGGLIRTPEELHACFEAGACAVTISKMDTIRRYREKYDSETGNPF